MKYELLSPLARDIYGLTKGNEPDIKMYKNFRIPLGTFEPHDSYDWSEEISREEMDKRFYWYEINLNKVFNWVIISRAGTHKTWFLKRLMTYFYYNNYKICAFDAKGDSLVSGKFIGKRMRFHPMELPTKLPIQGYLPSFTSSQHYGDMSLEPKVVLNFDNHFTINFKDLQSLDEWKTLIGATDSSANIIIDTLQKYKVNSLQGLLKKANRLSFKEGGHHAAKGTIANRLKTFIHHEVFNIKRQKIIEDKSVNNVYLNLKSVWRKGIIPIISFYMADNRYMKIVVNNIINQEWRINRSINEQRRLNILNIFDDSQFYFNKGEFNVAAINAARTIDLGRTTRFNGIYVVQNPNQFHSPIIESAKDKFFSDLDDPGILSGGYGRDIVDMVKELNNRSNPRKHNYAWLHVPPAKRYATIFYPGGSPVYHDLSG